MTARVGPSLYPFVLGLLLFWPLPSARAGSEHLTGRTVRVWAPSVTQKRMVGTLVSTSPSHILLTPEKSPRDTLSVELEAVRVLEVAEGKRSNMLLGAIAGMGAGALIGAAVGQLSRDDSNSPGNNGDKLALGIGVGVGFLAGTVFGIMSESEVWKRIPPDRLRPGETGWATPVFGVVVNLNW
jgi:hypothetical protein